MSRFLVKIMLFGLPLLLLAFLLEYLLRQIPNDYSYKNNYLSENSEKLETLVLGTSSSMYGINPVYLAGEAFNASHRAQSLPYDYFIYNKFKDKLVNLKWIILPVSYLNLFHALEGEKEDQLVKNYSIYYKCRYHYSLHYNSEILGLSLPLLLKRVYKYFQNKEDLITVSELGFALPDNKNKQRDMFRTGVGAAKRHTKKTFDYLKVNVEAINTLLVESGKKNVKVLLYTPPAWETYSKNFDKKQLKTMKDTIENIVSHYPHVKYHSFMDDSRFKKSDFYDANHLNGTGAKKFTKIIGLMMKSAAEVLVHGKS